MKDGNGTGRIEQPGSRRCVAMASSTGERCRKAPIRGATVCATHGGSVGRVKAAAARRLAEEHALTELAHLDVAPLGNPLEALAQLGGEALWWKDAMRKRVAALTSVSYEST